MDAAHFIFATFLGYLWCQARCFLKSHAGRKRYNVLGIELVYLPSYSPNLNLIERFWKFVKKEVLYSAFHEDYTAFKQDIDQCINYAFIKDKEKLESLLTNNFQSFKNIKILPV